MKIALIKLPPTYADWYRQPALGIAYISAYLKTCGIQSRIFDAYFHAWTIKELARRVIEYDPDVLGFTSMTHEIGRTAQLARGLKERLGVPVIIGGCHVTAIPEETLTEFPVFDYGVCGEGEKTLARLMEGLEEGSEFDPEKVNGLVFFNGKSISRTGTRSFMSGEELDNLPFPDFQEYYGDNPRALSGRKLYYPICTSRGCPYRCAFCMRVLGKEIRRRGVENICQEIENAVSQYGAHTFNFIDEIFLSDDQRTRTLLNSLIQMRYSLKIRWSGLTRANLVTRELIKLAKEAGCFRLEMGVESGDEKILKAINKGITIDQVKNAVEIIKSEGIKIATYYILGHPGETRETIRKTVDLAAQLNTETIAVGLMVPYPGTSIYEMALKGEEGYRLLSRNWALYDKYGGKVLELDGMPYREMLKWQKKAYVYIYLKNLRLLDFAGFFWKRKRALFFLIKSRLNRMLKR